MRSSAVLAALCVSAALLVGASAAGRQLTAVELETPAGSYLAAYPVSAYLGLSSVVQTIKGHLAAGNAKAAYDAYTGSKLQELGMGQGLSGPAFEKSSAYYGTPSFNDDYVMSAFGLTELAAMAEMVEKTVMDAIPVQVVLSKCHAGALTSGQADWDACAAAYIGEEMGSSPYARAEKRASNYNTFASNGAASVNDEVLSLLNGGPSSGAYLEIEKQIKIIYAQAAVRYAFLLDNDMANGLSTVDHRAEGQAFYRIVAPWVASDAACDSAVTAIYDHSVSLANGGMYCAAKCIFDALELGVADVGVLEGTDSVVC